MEDGFNLAFLDGKNPFNFASVYDLYGYNLFPMTLRWYMGNKILILSFCAGQTVPAPCTKKTRSINGLGTNFNNPSLDSDMDCALLCALLSRMSGSVGNKPLQPNSLSDLACCVNVLILLLMPRIPLP